MDVSDLEFQDAKGKPVKKGRNLFRLSEWVMKTVPAIAPSFLQFPAFNPNNDSSNPQWIGAQQNSGGLRILIGPIMILIQPLTATFATVARLDANWTFSPPVGIQFLSPAIPGNLAFYAWCQVTQNLSQVNGRNLGMIQTTAISTSSVTFAIFSDDNSEFVSTDQILLTGFAIGLHNNA